MRHLTFILVLLIANTLIVLAQSNPSQYSVYMDIAHGQRFWNDPDDMVEGTGDDVERLQYLTRQIEKTASSLNAIPSEVTPEKMKVIYHGGRVVKGGTLFCFNNQSGECFGTYQAIKDGGKLWSWVMVWFPYT